MQDYWIKQTADKPAFPDLLWSRPENRAHAGKLLIVGGNKFGFAAPAEAYQETTKAGIGTARVLLPDSLQKTVGRTFEAGEYAPSNLSGSFKRLALAEVLAMSQWSDGVLLAGDFGRNSETAIVLEQFSAKYTGQLTITKDALDYFLPVATIIDRPQTILVASFAQLQKIALTARYQHAFTYDMSLLQLIEHLHHFSLTHPIALVVRHHDTLFVAVNGRVSTTPYDPEEKVWRVKTASYCAVWSLQNPSKIFESLTTAVLFHQ